MPHLINTDNERISITEDQYNFLKEKYGRNVEFTVINVKGELQKFVLDGQNWRQGESFFHDLKKEMWADRKYLAIEGVIVIVLSLFWTCFLTSIKNDVILGCLHAVTAISTIIAASQVTKFLKA